jgi:DHA1 family tetracycline resistance protein-like MFS transporter
MTCKTVAIVALALVMTISQSNDKPKNNLGFIFVFLTVTLDMLSIGIIIPIMPNLINQMNGGNIAAASIAQGWIAMAWAIAQFIFMPIIGAASDAYGRKNIFLLSNIGQAAAYVLSAIAPSLFLLACARIVAGVMSGSVSTAYAYVADTYEPSERAVKMGQLGAAFGLGFVLGPGIGGWLGDIDLRLPLWFSAVISTGAFFFGLFFLRESLPEDKRVKFSWTRANPLSTFSFFKTNPQIIGLTATKYLNDFAHTALPSTFILYALYRFDWGPKESGLLMMSVGAAGVIVQGGLVKRIVSAIGEKKALLFGLLCGSLGFVGYAVVSDVKFIIFAILFASLWGVYGASMQAFLTSKISPQEQGRLQGALGSLTATTGIFGPLLFTHIFAFSISDKASTHVPGASFYLSALLIFISLGLAIFVTRNFPSRIEH